jgi:D-alanyl-D-alanine carboxypeptidase (penicillin-binding protein 5/6)
MFKFLCLFVLCSKSLFAWQEALKISAESALLMNGDSGVILYEKNSHMLQFPASTTKIATAAFVLDSHPHLLDCITVVPKEALVTVSGATKKKNHYTHPPYWLEPDGTHMGLKEGEALLISDLLYGLLVASANDAANVIAQEVSGSIPKFMESLNNYVALLGCQNTTFRNPHGLHHPEHSSTAFDMALLARQALKNPLFRNIVSTTKYRRPTTNKQDGWVLAQSNQLLKKGRFHYPHAIGVKTGYTSLAQRNLVAAATKNGRTLIAVLLKCKERDKLYQDTISLFEAAFNEEMVERVVLKEGIKDFTLAIDGATQPITTYLPSEVTIKYYPSEEPSLRATIKWRDIPLPVLKDQPVGDIYIYASNDTIVAKASLLAQDNVYITWAHWLCSLLGL